MSMIFEYFTKKRLYFISEYFTYVQSWTSPLAAGQAQDLIFVLNFVFWLILSLGDRFNYDALASFR